MPLILLNKPYRVLSQFTDAGDRETLKRFIADARVYPAGRLDYDSEGLLLLTEDGALQARISQPRSKLPKRYFVQVEGIVGDAHLQALKRGVSLKDGRAAAVQADAIGEPGGLWPRNPPVRERRAIPVSWIALGIIEGRNRQVRRMTAAVGLPTLRLIRHSIGPFTLDGLAPGETRRMATKEAWRRLDAL